MSCTRSDLVEAMSVPSLMGRGDEVGLVIGYRKFYELIEWAKVEDIGFFRMYQEGSVEFFAMEMFISGKRPDVLFAYTAKEREQVLVSMCGLEILVNNNNNNNKEQK